MGCTNFAIQNPEISDISPADASTGYQPVVHFTAKNLLYSVIMMHKPLSEEQELLNELKKQERKWTILKWLLPIMAIWILIDHKTIQDPALLRTSLAMIFFAVTVGRWHGDPKSKLLIKLCEEKIEREFIEEEIEKSRKIAAQEKKIEDFLAKQSQQP